MRIGHIELSFGVERRQELLTSRAGCNISAEYREALLQLGRWSWLLTW